jgi:C_GCAxxG_C_C family probable redox protein
LHDLIKNKSNLIQRAMELGVAYEKTITGCCQCTIAAIQDALGVRNDAVFKAGSGLTAGGGVTCEGSCGGYTGGVMVMSSIFGRRRSHWQNDIEDKDCAHAMAKALMEKFNLTYGSNICSTIHYKIFGRNFNLRDAQDRDSFEDSGAHVDKCTFVVGKAAAWAVELILDELQHRSMKLEALH